MPLGRTRIWLGRFGLLCFGLLFSELFLRFLGYTPLGRTDLPASHLSTEPDLVWGWKLKASQSLLQMPGGSPKPYTETVWEGGLRATRLASAVPENSNLRLAFFGCSFMHGYGLDDTETLPWLVQEELPRANVLNYGTPGFGTYQSLLAMETELQISATGRRVVIYGFSDFHEGRNIADPENLRVWARRSTTGLLTVPYVQVENERLIRVPPLEFPNLPLRRYSTVVSLLEELYLVIDGRSRLRSKQIATELLLLEMRDRAQTAGAHLIILIQSMPEERRSQYKTFFERNKIDYIADRHPRQGTSEMQLPDGHPNGRLNAYWAELVVKHASG